MSFGFSLFEPKVLTEAELQQSSADWLSRIGPTLIDQWPADLLGLSIPTIFIPMPQNCTGLYEPKTFHSIADDLARQIDEVIGWDRKFFRLNSRSPKDAAWPFEVLASCSGKEIMSVIASSERCLDDFCHFARAKLPPVLCLRDFWPNIRPEYEFRCFIKDGATMAIAEYKDRPGAFEFDTRHDQALRARIDAYLDDVVKPRLHIQTVVVDVVLRREGVSLLEINPYGLSNPVGAVSYDAIEQVIPGIARLPGGGKQTAVLVSPIVEPGFEIPLEPDA